jgi:hypothetical protein
MIDDCQLAEAISILFTVLSTLAWRLDHCRIKRWQTGVGEHLLDYPTNVKSVDLSFMYWYERFSSTFVNKAS